ncbi:Uncharacterised protein [Vibrio cholerae]|nr:Uncharacterised protein [Vibrio cholerae]CSC97915.1 Uncharacterised protein [Vibrio cholerae]CSI10945.1 Uncharacterised protein [Vibrio cholerae]CSI49635.1 Uncharacterised protein [Vibrio cholerae]
MRTLDSNWCQTLQVAHGAVQIDLQFCRSEASSQVDGLESLLLKF